MVTVAVATIIAAICAVLGGLIGTISTGWWARHNESLRRRTQEQDALRRYYDPLLRASQDLQHQIRGLLQNHVPKVDITTENAHRSDSLNYAKTLYFFGQFFAWNRAIRNVVHEMHHTPSEEDSKVRKMLHDIEKALEGAGEGPEPTTFQISTVFQVAIGEIILKKDSSGKVISCIEFTNFLAKLSNNHVDDAGVALQQWFDPIITGLSILCSITEEFPSISKDPPNVSPNFPRCKLRRLIRFQHLLVELIHVLDPGQERSPSYETRPIPNLDDSFTCACKHCYCPKKPFDGGMEISAGNLFPAARDFSITEGHFSSARNFTIEGGHLVSNTVFGNVNHNVTNRLQSGRVLEISRKGELSN